MTRGALVVVICVLAAACATSRQYPHPLTGEMWGYLLTSLNIARSFAANVNVFWLLSSVTVKVVVSGSIAVTLPVT